MPDNNRPSGFDPILPAVGELIEGAASPDMARFGRWLLRHLEGNLRGTRSLLGRTDPRGRSLEVLAASPGGEAPARPCTDHERTLLRSPGFSWIATGPAADSFGLAPPFGIFVFHDDRSRPLGFVATAGSEETSGTIEGALRLFAPRLKRGLEDERHGLEMKGLGELAERSALDQGHSPDLARAARMLHIQRLLLLPLSGGGPLADSDGPLPWTEAPPAPRLSAEDLRALEPDEQAAWGSIMPFPVRGGLAWVLRAQQEPFAQLVALDDLPLDPALASHPIFTILFDRMVAERSRKAVLESQITQERLQGDVRRRASLGTLAGGLAHEFNNLLAIISGNVELALAELPSGHPVRNPLVDVTAALSGATKLAGQVLAYSGGGTVFTSAHAPDAFLESLAPHIQDRLPAGCKWRFQIEPGLPMVAINPDQLRRAILNLVDNAAETTFGHGSLVLSVGRPELESTGAVRIGPQPSGEDTVVFGVRDDGPGMDPSSIVQAFEPYFSTKEPGRGLGLSEVQGVIQGHRGAVTVRSAPGLGTSVWLFLPIGRANDQTPVEKTAAIPRRVLVVDDEPLVLRVTERMVRKLGHEPTAVASGREALRAVQDTPFDLALIDITMPDWDGPTTAQEIHRLRPGLPVLFTSGYASPTLDTSKLPSVRGFLQKPYDSASLSRAIAGALGVTGGAAPTPGSRNRLDQEGAI